MSKLVVRGEYFSSKKQVIAVKKKLKDIRSQITLMKFATIKSQ